MKDAACPISTKGLREEGAHLVRAEPLHHAHEALDVRLSLRLVRRRAARRAPRGPRARSDIVRRILQRLEVQECEEAAREAVAESAAPAREERQDARERLCKGACPISTG